MVKKICVISFIVVFIFISGCGKSDSSNFSESPQSAINNQPQPSTLFNIFNSSVAETDDYIYFIDDPEAYVIYRFPNTSDITESDVEIFAEVDNCLSIDVWNNFLYYTDKNSICKIDLSNGKSTVLLKNEDHPFMLRAVRCVEGILYVADSTDIKTDKSVIVSYDISDNSNMVLIAKNKDFPLSGYGNTPVNIGQDGLVDHTVEHMDGKKWNFINFDNSWVYYFALNLDPDKNIIGIFNHWYRVPYNNSGYDISLTQDITSDLPFDTSSISILNNWIYCRCKEGMIRIKDDFSVTQKLFSRQTSD